MSLQPQKYAFDAGVQDDILKLMSTDLVFADAASRWVKPSYFSGEHRRVLAQIAIDFYHDYRTIPTSSQILTELSKKYAPDHPLRDDLHSTLKYMYLSAQSPQSRLYTIDLVADFAQTQSWREAIAEALPLLQRGDHGRVNEIMKEAYDTKYALDSGGYWYFESAAERCERRAERKDVSVIPTGILEVDSRIRNGGPEKGEVGLWIAPTNSGKSIALAQMARRSVWANENTAIFTLEMSDLKYSDRLDAGFTNTHMRDLDDSRLMIDSLRPLAQRFKRKLWIRRFPTKQATIEDLRACLEALARTENWSPGMIVIDYIDLLKPTRQRKESHKEKMELLEAFRGLCVEFNAVGWTATQTNRAGGDAATVRMGHVAGSWDSLGICDFILTITASDHHRKQDLVKLVFDKNRDGDARVTLGELPCDWGRMCFVKRSNLTPAQVLNRGTP